MKGRREGEKRIKGRRREDEVKMKVTETKEDMGKRRQRERGNKG